MNCCNVSGRSTENLLYFENYQINSTVLPFTATTLNIQKFAGNASSFSVYDCDFPTRKFMNNQSINKLEI